MLYLGAWAPDIFGRVRCSAEGCYILGGLYRGVTQHSSSFFGHGIEKIKVWAHFLWFHPVVSVRPLHSQGSNVIEATTQSVEYALLELGLSFGNNGDTQAFL